MHLAKFGNRLLQLALAGLLIVTLATFLERWFWAADLLVSFRPILTLAALVLLIACAISKQRNLILAALLILLINGRDLPPYYLPQTAAEQSNLRLLLYNADRNYLPYVGVDSVVRLINAEQPQVAVLLEVGEAEAAALEAALIDEFPYQHAHQDIPTDGYMILSQLPLVSAETVSIGGGRSAAAFVVEVEGQSVNVVAPHPTNPLWSLEERNQQVLALATWVESAETPLIVAGDLNVTMWSSYYKAVERAGVRNARRGLGIMPTWNSPIPLLTLPIDHILISSEIAVQRLTLAPSLGSDHLPQVADLYIR
ncbi:MAG: endonuclease/exonuclease/phosphatase family protein [Candidatus Promineifilaceae bacterium]